MGGRLALSLALVEPGEHAPYLSDRAEAEQLGKELLAALLRDEQVTSGVLALGDLWERYKTQCVAFLDNHAKTQLDDKGHAEVLRGFFGDDCDVRSLTASDQLAYTRKRIAGGIVCGEERETSAVRLRSVEADLKLLHTMLKWATTVRVRKGHRLLDSNPLEGVRRLREKNPKRPVATLERFEKTREAIQSLTAEADTDAARRKWLRLELALVLAEATGRRLGSIRQLAWSDVDMTKNSIRWVAANDKKGREWIVPVPKSLIDELQSFRVKLGGAFGGLVFPSESDPSVPIRADVFSKWLLAAEEKAELPKLNGSLWHAYRRGWATARKDLPISDVAFAGGWSDATTLVRCYQQPDEATLLRVMSEPRKVVEGVVGA
jgi:integrase